MGQKGFLEIEIPLSKNQATMKSQKIDERIISISDIPQQEQNLNGVIALHREKSQDGFMLRQYEFMRGEFLKELKALLEGLGVGAGELVEV